MIRHVYVGSRYRGGEEILIITLLLEVVNSLHLEINVYSKNEIGREI